MNSPAEFLLLDTDVVSYRYAKRPEFERFRPYIDRKTLAISLVTYAEQLEGGLRAGWADKKMDQFRAYLRMYLVIPADKELAATFARIHSACMLKGIDVSFSKHDVWTAATAVRHNIPLLANDRIFRKIRSVVSSLVVLPKEGDDSAEER